MALLMSLIMSSRHPLSIHLLVFRGTMVVQGMPFIPTPAPISLKVTIVGGGLSGLAAAYALRRAGHEVLILEKSDGSSRSMQSPGGLRSLPNMTKVLMNWGLEQELSRIAIEHESTNFLCAETGEKLGVVSAHLEDQIRMDTDLHFTSFLFAHGDVHNLLYDIAKREGVIFQFNATVVGADPGSGVVLLDNGEAIEADLIVGADGCHSTLRQYIESPEEKMSNNVENMLILSFTGTICPVDMKDDLQILERQADLNFCFGNRFFVSVHFHSKPEAPHYSVVLHHPYNEDDIPIRYQDWGPLKDVADFDFDFDQLAPWLRKLISRADQIWGRIASIKPTPHCFDNSRLVLVGEAIHTMSPGSASTPAMSLEDAQTLGCLFSVIENKNQIHRLLTAFDEIRLPRAAFAHYKDTIHTELAMLAAGPHRDMRDEFLIKSLEQNLKSEDEEMLEFYEEDIRMYAYDPGEETVSWWSRYGAMILDSTERKFLEVRVHVTV
ncbi:hypothetical protein CPB83DRAFT_906740 [Crepidotus variabilis]|uniref:FAD-binding domain-containing protein n=1 Tax=Crepidotus variabilis TaxID=179855 RepID=A0A9P6JQC4_9AGAR|nr:hypothetical protein CPB83DRAFT_906740 [Crepidotus variabilis]